MHADRTSPTTNTLLLSFSTSLLLHTVGVLSESDRPAPSDDGLELEMQNYIADN